MKTLNILRQPLQILLVVLTLASAGMAWAEVMPGDAAININTATAEEMATGLKGIGQKKAEAIVTWREQNGKFTSADQLTAVKGIGESILSQNSDKIRLE